MKYEAIVFDLDGTLLDTIDDLADCMNATLAEFGYGPQPVDNYKYYVGDGVVALARRASEDENITDEKLEKIVARNREIYGNGWANKTRPYDGIVEMIDALADKGVKMCVLSNKPDHFTRLCVEHFFDASKFEIVQGVCDEVPPKPNPTGLSDIVEKLGIPLEKFLYVGDTNTDMKTAVGGKMMPVGVTWGFRPADELTENGAKILVNSPKEITELL